MDGTYWILSRTTFVSTCKWQWPRWFIVLLTSNTWGNILSCPQISNIVIGHTHPQYTGSMSTVHPKKYAHCFVVLCFVVVMQSFIMNSYEVFIHIHQGCFAGTGAIVRLSQCQWSKPDGYGKISQCITTTKHSKAKTVCIFLGIYCRMILVIYMRNNRTMFNRAFNICYCMIMMFIE